MGQFGQWINDWLHQTGNSWQNIGIAIGVFLLSWVLRKMIVNYGFNLILKMTSRTKTDLERQIFLAFERPLQIILILFGLQISLSFIVFDPAVSTFLSRLFRSAVILLLTWGVFALTGESSGWLEAVTKRFRIEIDKIVLPFFTNLIRFLVVALALSIVAQEWGYNVTALVTGLGIGGLAFAFAAQDTIANFFGGLVIVTEKPFSIGDWIETPSVEGTVEDITFRSTRVRTFAQALVTVPNSKLANEPIVNWSEMGKRRISFTLRVKHTTPPEKIRNSVNRIRTMLREHPEIHQETLFVHFNEFSESSLDIMLYFFTKTTVWSEWLEVKEDCNMRILQILEDEGVEIALRDARIYYGDNDVVSADAAQTPEEWLGNESNKTVG